MDSVSMSDKDLRNKIDLMACSIRGMAVQIKWCIEVFECISDRAEEINKIKRFSHVFGLFQDSVLDRVILKTSIIFGDPIVLGFEQDSLISLLKLLRKLGSVNLNPLKEFIFKYTGQKCTDNNALKQLKNVLKSFSSQHKATIKSLKNARNSRVAHSPSESKAISLPPLVSVNDMARFAYDFSGVALLSCVNVHASDYDELFIKTDVYVNNILDQLYAKNSKKP